MDAHAASRLSASSSPAEQKSMATAPRALDAARLAARPASPRSSRRQIKGRHFNLFVGAGCAVVDMLGALWWLWKMNSVSNLLL